MNFFRRALIASTLMMAACEASADEVITLTSGEWLPYLSERAPHHSVVSRIVTEAFALEGVRVNYIFRPWSRAYAEALGGGAHGTVVWSVAGNDTARKRDFHASAVVFEGRSVFFHRKDYPFRLRDTGRLAGLRIGGTAGYEYRFEKYPGIVIDRSAATDELNFQKLLGGRFDLFPTDLYVGLDIMRRILTPEQAARLTWDPQPYEVTAYHLLLNRKNPANSRYLALFNRGLKKLRDSGKYAQYMHQ